MASSSGYGVDSVDSETFYGPRKKKHPGRQRTEIVSKPLAFPPPVSMTKRQYTVRYKLWVLSYLEHARVPLGPTTTREVTAAETGRQFKIPAANIGWWKKQEKEVLASLASQRRNRIGRRKWPRIERSLYDRFMDRRGAGKIVRQGWFRITSKSLMVEHYPGDIFCFSNGWFSGSIFFYI